MLIHRIFLASIVALALAQKPHEIWINGASCTVQCSNFPDNMENNPVCSFKQPPPPPETTTPLPNITNTPTITPTTTTTTSTTPTTTTAKTTSTTPTTTTSTTPTTTTTKTTSTTPTTTTTKTTSTTPTTTTAKTTSTTPTTTTTKTTSTTPTTTTTKTTSTTPTTTTAKTTSTTPTTTTSTTPITTTSTTPTTTTTKTTSTTPTTTTTKTTSTTPTTTASITPTTTTTKTTTLPPTTTQTQTSSISETLSTDSTSLQTTDTPLTESTTGDSTFDSTSYISTDSTYESTETTTPFETTTLNSENCFDVKKQVCLNGDPHYRTFDGTHFDYQGTCPHVFVKQCPGIVGFHNFSVIVKNKKIGKVSKIESAQIEIYNHTIFISLSSSLYVNGIEKEYPYHNFLNEDSDKFYRIEKEGHKISFFTENSIQLFMDSSMLCVEIPDCPEYFGTDKLCGLAGNYNGYCGDDLVYKNGTLEKGQDYPCSYENTVNKWANNWVIPKEEYFSPTPEIVEPCVHGVDGTESRTCDAAIATCQPIHLALKGEGPFSKCKEMVYDEIYSEYSKCVDHVCADKNKKCEVFKKFADICGSKLQSSNSFDWNLVCSTENSESLRILPEKHENQELLPRDDIQTA